VRMEERKEEGTEWALGTHLEKEFDNGQGKVGEIQKSQGNCGLPVMCYHKLR